MLFEEEMQHLTKLFAVNVDHITFLYDFAWGCYKLFSAAATYLRTL